MGGRKLDRESTVGVTRLDASSLLRSAGSKPDQRSVLIPLTFDPLLAAGSTVAAATSLASMKSIKSLSTLAANYFSTFFSLISVEALQKLSGIVMQTMTNDILLIEFGDTVGSLEESRLNIFCHVAVNGALLCFVSWTARHLPFLLPDSLYRRNKILSIMVFQLSNRHA